MIGGAVTHRKYLELQRRLRASLNKEKVVILNKTILKSFLLLHKYPGHHTSATQLTYTLAGCQARTAGLALPQDSPPPQDSSREKYIEHKYELLLAFQVATEA